MFQFWHPLIELVKKMTVTDVLETEIMLIVLGRIDVVRISSLLVMAIVSGWEKFVLRVAR